MGKEVKPSATLESARFQILENCPDATVLFDRNWSLVYVNPAFRRRFSPRRPPEGTDFLSYLDPASAARLRDHQGQLLQGNQQIELRHMTPEPRTISLQYSFFPAGGSQEPLIVGIGRDHDGDLNTLLETIHLNLELERKQKELSEANARLEQLAITDPITELYNRHYFFRISQQFWEEAKRYRLPLAVILMDIDNFKSVNDRHGHLFGDYVLRHAARRLRKNTRKSDTLARFGGDELVVLASHTGVLTGQVLAERLRLSMVSEPFVMDNCSATVTISAGISCIDLVDFPNFDALLDSSDQALYGAKQAGKNCVFTYTAKTLTGSGV